LIALAQIGHFDLLRLLYSQLHIPPAVRDEVVTSGCGRRGTDKEQGGSSLPFIWFWGRSAV